MKAFEIAGLPSDEVSSFLAGKHSDPFRVLGPHRVGNDLEIRVFRPDARKIDIILNQDSKRPIPAERTESDGFFCATIAGASRDLDYHLQITRWDGSEELLRDPYQYGPIMGEVDVHLFGEGQHWKIYEQSGALSMERCGMDGSAAQKRLVEKSSQYLRGASWFVATQS